MNATFNIKVTIDNNNVATAFGSEKIEDMDTTLLASVLKIFGDVQNRVKKQVAQSLGTKEQPESAPATEGEQTSNAPAQELQEENEQQ